MWTDYINTGAQVALALTALYALKQISVAKNNTVINSRRESIKYASDLAAHYLQNIIPIQNELYELQKKLGFKDYKFDLDFNKIPLEKFTDEEARGCALREHYLYTEEFEKNHPEITGQLLREQNAMEAFSAPFVAGVADEDVAFKTVGITFCLSVAGNYYAYCSVRFDIFGELMHFENTIALYNLWAPRIKKSKLSKLSKETQAALSGIKEDHIKPIGT